MARKENGFTKYSTFQKHINAKTAYEQAIFRG